jgi:coenzyme F420-reducing hydrogenase gamma subunit
MGLATCAGSCPRTASDAASSTQERVVRRIGDGDHRITVPFQQLEQTIDLDHPRPAH